MANDDESDLMKAWRKGLISQADLRPRLSPDGEPYVEWSGTCSAFRSQGWLTTERIVFALVAAFGLVGFVAAIAHGQTLQAALAGFVFGEYVRKVGVRC